LSEGRQIKLFEEARGGVEPWLMARWKARVEVLLNVIELLYLHLTVEALQGKTCQNSLLWEGVGQFEPRFQGKGSTLGIFLASRMLDTFCYLKVQTAPTVLRTVVLTQYRRVADGRTDRRTEML